MNKFHSIAFCYYANAAILIFLAVYFVLIPLVLMTSDLTDPGLKGEGIPRAAFRLHRSLSPEYENWAQQRIASEKAKNLTIENIEGTEWPVFGSVFYLWATESLQEAWETNKSYSDTAPNVYAANAIKAATALIADPGHASWVKEHWGEDYLHRENVFYRTLLISAFTSYEKLLGDQKYSSTLRNQVETLSSDLDESRYGLLDDYPGQCYPCDVIAAIAAIKRADEVLGTDHSDFVKRSIRAFQGRWLDSTSLPPYFANLNSGNISIARGCSTQWAVVWACELWPDESKEFYDNFEKHFLQKNRAAVGFREFPKGTLESDWYLDVDAGPVVDGFGMSASAFGLGTARANGRFDHAYPLAAELIVISTPLPDGTLMLPRILSSVSDAPYVGEAGLLFALTRMPVNGVKVVANKGLPFVVYFILTLYLCLFAILILAAVMKLKRCQKNISTMLIPWGEFQFIVWITFVFTGVVLYFANSPFLGLTLVFIAQLLPRCKKKKLVD